MTPKIYAKDVPATLKFHIGDLVTLASGIMVSPAGKEGLYELVDYMTGTYHLRSGLFGEQLLVNAEVCKLVLLTLHPWLAEITVPKSVHDAATGQVFLDMVSERYGSHHEIPFKVARP